MSGRALGGLFVLAFAAVLLSGCGLPEEARRRVDTVLGEAAPALAEARAPKETRFPGTVRVHRGVWLGGAATAFGDNDPLPAHLETAKTVTLSSRAPLTLELAAERLSAIGGLPVRLDEDLEAPPPARSR